MIALLIMNLRGKNVLVLGMGETGLSMVKVAVAQWGERACGRQPYHSALSGGLMRVLPERRYLPAGLQPEAFAGIDLIAISPGVPWRSRLVQQAADRGVPVVGDMELFALAIGNGTRTRNPQGQKL